MSCAVLVRTSFRAAACNISGGSSCARNISLPSISADTESSIDGFRRRFLPQPVRRFSSGPAPLTIVLDMDECMLHSQFIGPEPSASTMGQHGTPEAGVMLDRESTYRQHESARDAHYARKKVRRPKKKVVGHLAQNPYAGLDRGGAEDLAEEEEPEPPPACDSFTLSLPDNGDVVHVIKRPHLYTFLEEIDARFGASNVLVFTAAMECYARPVLDAVGAQGGDAAAGVLKKRFYREYCSQHPVFNAYIKDFTTVLGENFNPGRTVLIDNNAFSFAAQPDNGIPVKNFYDDPADNSLLNVLEILEELEGLDDVRPALAERFGIREGLESLLQDRTIES